MPKAHKTSQKQTNLASETDKSDFGNPKDAFAILLAITVAVAVVLLAIHLVKAAGDKSRFHWAEARLNYAKNQLSNITGLSVSSSWHNGCAPITEQPLNNAQDCSTELFAEYTVTSKAQAMQAQAAISELMISPQVFGTVFDNQATSTTYNIPSKGLNCFWLNGFTPDSSQVQDGEKTTISFTASCTAPSATTIYTQ